MVARPWYGTDNGHGVPCPYDTKFKSPTLKNEGWGTPRAVIRHCHADEREGGRYETNCHADEREGGRYETNCHADEREGGRYETNCHADEREGGARRNDLLRGARQTLCRCGCGATLRRWECGGANGLQPNGARGRPMY